MTATEITTNGHDPAGPPATGQLSRDEGRAVVRRVLASGGKARRADLVASDGMSERWWGDRISEVRSEAGTADGTPPAAARPRPPVPAPPATRGVARTGPARRPATARRGQSVERLRRAAVAAVALVAVGVAVLSYNHVVDLAERAEVGHPAWLVPLTLDGMVVAATCSLAVDWMTPGRRGELAAWFGAGTGLAISMAANVIAVDPSLVPMEVVRWVGAGYPPLALAQAVHILARIPRAAA